MYYNFLKFSSKAQRIKLPIIASIVISYVVTTLLLLNYYDGKVKNAKSVFLNNNYQLILETSLHKFKSIVSRLNIDLQASSISLNNNYIKICENEKCINYELQKFQSLLRQSIPNFNNFKIELNNNLIYSNSIFENYEIEKIHYLNQSNKLLIRVNVDNNYWHQIAKDIKKPFWIIITFLSFSFVVLCYLCRVLSKNFEQEYQSKYDIVAKNCDIEVKKCEKLWMTKLWDRDFSKIQDAEINYLFSQEAAKIMFLSENNLLNKKDNVISFEKQYLEEKLYCSIALYNPFNQEEVDVQRLIKIFTSRFEKEDENISFSILCFEKQIYFSSTAAFYQIIYSTISYLFFLLKKQFSNGKHDINVVISNIAGKLLFNFSYSGVPIEKERDLFKMSNEFARIHANPFILSIEQIFKLLKLSGFNCRLNHDKSNIIEISEKAIKKNKIAKNSRDNVIYLTNWNKEE